MQPRSAKQAVGSRQLLLGPQHLPLLPTIDIQNLARDMATPGLASQEKNAPRDRHGWNGLGECGADGGMLVLDWTGEEGYNRKRGDGGDGRSLGLLPVLLGVLLAFVFELVGVDGAGGDGIDPTYIHASALLLSHRMHRAVLRFQEGNSPSARKNAGDITFQTLQQPRLHGALPTRIIGIHPLAEMAALAAYDDQTDVARVRARVLDLPHPPFCGQHCAFDVDAVGLPPLFDGHVHEGAMVREDAEIERCECDAALHDAEIAAGGLEGAGELFFGGDVHLVEFEMEVLDRDFGLADVEDGDVGPGGQECFHLRMVKVLEGLGGNRVCDCNHTVAEPMYPEPPVTTTWVRSNRKPRSIRSSIFRPCMPQGCERLDP